MCLKVDELRAALAEKQNNIERLEDELNQATTTENQWKNRFGSLTSKFVKEANSKANERE